MSTIELTKHNFDDIVAKNDLVIVDFWAEWCGPCKSFAPIFAEVSEKYPDVIFGKVDTEAEPELARDFQVRSIPLILVLRQQVAVFSQPGALPASALMEVVEQAKALDMKKVLEEIQRQASEE